MVKTGIVGVSGYSGGVLLEILLKHKDARVTYVSANNTQGKIDDIWPKLKGQSELFCDKFDLKKAVSLCDLVFLAVPHTIAMEITPELLKQGKKVIDISGDYRLPTASVYKKWYGADHKDTSNLKKAVYGLPELYREKIKKADLISNPGCYPTAAILGLSPVVTSFPAGINSIIIDAKSGMSGAGKKAKTQFIFSELNENFYAYKVLNHQHAPEIDLHLGKLEKKTPPVNFVPHLLPVNRGILETIYVHLGEKTGLEKIHSIYKRFYKTESFVRVLEPQKQPQLKDIAGTNFCDIGLEISPNGKLLVITSVIDNLLKGASGQAVQNMNIMLGFKETEGLL
ncbi:MAG: N-acetyl-gamma-glutamyl-phosphate reductase [Candidatus Omnitrophica bacterium]|nr:N-acetyl-gamma-glutamyl-phosphate reductase [Candidatus Omnitrophota bacterium]